MKRHALHILMCLPMIVAMMNMGSHGGVDDRGR